MSTHLIIARTSGFMTCLFLMVLACAVPADVSAQNVVTEPEFPGGTTGLITYLSQQIKYPASAYQDKVEGLSVISFVIEKNGKVSNATVKKGFHKDCDAEALRVVRSMPDWTPGKKGGKNVRTEYTLPVQFKLN